MLWEAKSTTTLDRGERCQWYAPLRPYDLPNVMEAIVFDLITGGDTVSQCARSAEYTFAGKIAMEIAKHAADGDWLDLRLQEAWADPSPLALDDLEILDLSPWPNEETMVQVSFRIHQYKQATTKDPELRELYRMSNSIAGQQTVKDISPMGSKMPWEEKESNSHVNHGVIQLASADLKRPNSEPSNKPTSKGMDPTLLRLWCVAGSGIGAETCRSDGGLKAQAELSRGTWSERLGTLYLNGRAATVPECRGFRYKNDDLGDDLEKILQKEININGVRSRWTLVRSRVLKLGRTDLAALCEGGAGRCPQMNALEAEVNFLLHRERKVIRDLAGVASDLKTFSNLDAEELDLELGEQGLGDSLHDWDSKGDFGRFVIPIDRSPLGTLSLARQRDLIRSKLGWFRKDRLALEDIAGEAWKRIHFRTECEAVIGACWKACSRGPGIFYVHLMSMNCILSIYCTMNGENNG